MQAISGQGIPLPTAAMRLNRKPAENLQIRLNLNEHLLHTFCHQFTSLMGKSERGLSVGVGDPNVQAPAGEQAIH